MNLSSIKKQKPGMYVCNFKKKYDKYFEPSRPEESKSKNERVNKK